MQYNSTMRELQAPWIASKETYIVKYKSIQSYFDNHKRLHHIRNIFFFLETKKETKIRLKNKYFNLHFQGFYSVMKNPEKSCVTGTRCYSTNKLITCKKHKVTHKNTGSISQIYFFFVKKHMDVQDV